MDDIKIFIGCLWVFTGPPTHTLHPSVEQRNDSHGLTLCAEFARLQIRFSGIRNVNDTLGSCVKRDGMVYVSVCLCVIGSLCKATTRLLHFPWACDSLIKYSYIPCKYMENTVNPQRAVCPLAQMLFHVSDRNPQMSHPLPAPPSCPFNPCSSFPSSKVEECRWCFAPAYLMFPLCPHSWLAVHLQNKKRHRRTQRSDRGSKWCLYVFGHCFSMVEKNRWGILLAFCPPILTLALALSQKGQFPPLKSKAHHNTRICIVQENSPA